LCARCANEPRCAPIIKAAEGTAYKIMEEAFRRCGAKAYVMRNVVLEYDKFVRR